MTVPPERGRPRAKDIQAWAMWIHFSQFAGILIPFAGLIVPVILWQAKRGEFPDLDPHGKAVTNWGSIWPEFSRRAEQCIPVSLSYF